MRPISQSRGNPNTRSGFDRTAGIAAVTFLNHVKSASGSIKLRGAGSAPLINARDISSRHPTLVHLEISLNVASTVSSFLPVALQSENIAFRKWIGFPSPIANSMMKRRNSVSRWHGLRKIIVPSPLITTASQAFIALLISSSLGWVDLKR